MCRSPPPYHSQEIIQNTFGGNIMTYKISYLSNGNKVKITNELFYKLKNGN